MNTAFQKTGRRNTKDIYRASITPTARCTKLYTGPRHWVRGRSISAGSQFDYYSLRNVITVTMSTVRPPPSLGPDWPTEKLGEAGGRFLPGRPDTTDRRVGIQFVIHWNTITTTHTHRTTHTRRTTHRTTQRT